MKGFRIIIPIIIIGLCAIGDWSWAERAYVTDSFEITVRTGPSVENKILTLLNSGQAVEVLESNEKWTRVSFLGRGESAVEGWVLSRYLESRVPWKAKAASLEEENIRLKKDLALAGKRSSDGALLEQNLSRQLEETSRELKKLRDEYKTLRSGAADYIEVKAAYDRANSSLETIQKKVQRLTKENDNLKSSERNTWLGMGALVLLCGLMIGVVVGRQQRKHKSVYY